MSLLTRVTDRYAAGAALGCAGAIAAALTAAAVAPAAAQTLTPIAQISQTSTTQSAFTSFDISYVDAATHTYILGDRTQAAVDVINTQTNQITALVGKGQFVGFTGNNDTSGPNGVMIVNSKEIWAGDGNSTVKIYALGSGALIANVPTGGVNRADEMCYDPVHSIAVVANDADSPPFITFWNINTHQVIKTIKFDGKPGDGPNATNGIEQCQWDSRDQKFYLNVPEVNGPGDNSQPGAVVYMDPATQTILNVYTVPLSSCSGPQGMAIGPAPQILLGCNGGPSQPAFGYPTAIINDGSTGGTRGSVYRTLLNEEGSDEVNYDAFSNTYQLAESSFNPPPPNGTASCTSNPITAGPQHIGIVGGVNGTEGTSVVSGLYNCPTSPHGSNHSVASDPNTGHVFVPIASTAGGTLCSQFGGLDSYGCIMVFQATGCPACSSISWRNTGGNVVAWEMNGGAVEANTSVGSAPGNWSIVGRGDFAGTGDQDLLWRDTSGNTAIWLTTNGVVTSSASLGNVPTSWSVAGTGDFNGDGTTDILWRDSSGNTAIWLLNGGAVASTASLGNVPNNWSVAGVHRNQIVWKDTGGDVAVWTINGGQVASTAGLGNVGSSWSIASVGDFTGFGNAGLVWRDTGGNLALWQLDSSGQVASSAGLGNIGSSWTLAETQDLNFDGKSDLVWRDSSGNTALWLMNGGAVTAGLSLGSVPTSWSIQAGND